MKVRRKKDVQKPSHKKYKSKKKLKRVLLWIKSILVASLLVITVVYTALSPYFNVNKMVVKGADRYDHQTLIAASGVNVGDNGFRQIFSNPEKFYFLRFGFAEKAVMERCPYIKSVKVRFVIPSTVSIEVKEREAAAVLSLTGTSILIDREGYLLEIIPDLEKPDLEKPDLPVIQGIKIEAFTLGKKINEQEEALLTAFNVFDTIKEMDSRNTDKLLPSVDYIDVGDIYNISLSLQSRVLVNLGEPEDLNYKINAVQTIFTKNIKKNERGKLDFSSDGNPVFTLENGG